jgi:hypothetical protein
MKRVPILLIACLLSLSLSACVAARNNAQPESAYIVNSQGAVSPTSRSALAGSTAPGKQEILGLYIPFIGTGLAVKAGLEWDGTPTVIEVPVASAPQYAAPQSAPTMVPRTVMVPETRTVMVPKTVYDRQVTIPVPQAAPQTGCPMPPPEPISMTDDEDACPDGSCSTLKLAKSGR